MDSDTVSKCEYNREYNMIKRHCDFHQLYRNRDKENHVFVGPAYQCVECRNYGCKDCIDVTDYEERQANFIYICIPCLTRHQVRIDIEKITVSNKQV